VEEFKLIVAGGRDFNDYVRASEEIVRLASAELKGYAVSIVCGMAYGADAQGLRFAKEHDIKWYEFPADWDSIDVPGAVVKYNTRGKPYNAAAGHLRNKAMGDFADGLLAFWDGESRGTKNMIEYMHHLGKNVRVINY
jgi:hypothetical protein